VGADAGNLVQAGDGVKPGCAGAGARAGAGGAVGVDALGGGDRRDQLFDPGGERADLRGQRVDLTGQHAGQLGVMAVELPGERLDQRGPLGLHLAAGQAGQHLRVALPGDQRLQHVTDRQGVHGAGHGRHFNQRVFQQLLQPLPVPGPVAGQVGARRV
jgi:hypothetical protein